MCSTCPLPDVLAEAFRHDAALSAVARSLGALDLALGATVAPLFDRGLLAELSYARESDYARERLGMSPAAVSSCVRLARELKTRPILRRAVTAGAVSPRKALAVLTLAVGDGEAAWTEAAMRLSVREIESAAKAAGKASPEERFEAEAIVLPMTPGQQERLDAALALARDDLGPEAKRWQCMEAISEEFLSSFAEHDPAGRDGEGPRPPAARPPPMSPHAAKVVARQLAAIDEALAAIRRIEEELPGEDALSLDARAMRLVAARRRYDEALGILARRMLGAGWHETLRYGFEQYCEERLGMRAGAVRTRIWLERRMEELPALREALSSGRIGYTKAVIVARRATWADVGDRIARARATTCQQLGREAQEEEDREGRKRGTRHLWSPSDAAQTVRDAIAAAQAKARAERGAAIDAGEALAVVADHFVEVWEAHHPDWIRKWRSEQRRRVLMRKGGLCSVPGCSRAAVHVHHVVFRSRGGAKKEWNEIGICAVHHLHGIHLGYLEVSGRAGERLEWRFATGEAWVTLGDDDVRRADRRGAPASAPAGAPRGGGPGAGGGSTDVNGAPGPHPGDRSTDVNGAAGPAAGTHRGGRSTDVNGGGRST
ncbi:MAG: HNH endonuclease, partial [Planctomycetes bacterium]|nr:HNH endonuclease [Planctomycetota bacterium]